MFTNTLKAVDRVLMALSCISCLFLASCFLGTGHGGDDGHGDHGHSLDTVQMPQELQSGTWNRERLYARGEVLFNGMCIQCHQEHGVGLPGIIPPLHESDFAMADRTRLINVVLRGLKGPIVVNGEAYDNSMPPIQGSDLNVAAVLTYVRNHCNGSIDSIAPSEVAGQR